MHNITMNVCFPEFFTTSAGSFRTLVPCFLKIRTVSSRHSSGRKFCARTARCGATTGCYICYSYNLRHCISLTTEDEVRQNLDGLLEVMENHRYCSTCSKPVQHVRSLFDMFGTCATCSEHARHAYSHLAFAVCSLVAVRRSPFDCACCGSSCASAASRKVGNGRIGHGRVGNGRVQGTTQEYLFLLLLAREYERKEMKTCLEVCGGRWISAAIGGS
ncbi:hypothetical protein HOY80DRAFT_70487 [Tuber brumale]|nr:hypothetical protein HOY80DRAFT_70487 [Tuber brumale]